MATTRLFSHASLTNCLLNAKDSVNGIYLLFFNILNTFFDVFFFAGKENQKPPTSKPRPTQIHPRTLVDSARLYLPWVINLNEAYFGFLRLLKAGWSPRACGGWPVGWPWLARGRFFGTFFSAKKVREIKNINLLRLHSLKPILIHTCIFILYTSFSFHVLAQNPGKKAFNDAEALRNDGNCKEAIAQYNAAIEKENNNYRYLFGKAQCEYALKDFRSAKRSLERAIEHKKDFTTAYSILAKIYRIEKDYDNAIFYYREASVVEKDAVRKLQYHLLVINLLMNEKRVSEAREMVNSAMKLDAQHPGVMYYQAELLLSESNWTAAQETYQAALASPRLQNASAKDKAKYYFGLGVAYYRLNEKDKADEAWEKAQFGPYKKLIEKEKETKNDEQYYKIAVSYYLQGAYKESQSYLDKALELNDQFVNVYVLQGRIAEKQGRMDEAVIAYQQAISAEIDENKAAKIRIMEADIHLNNEHGERALSALDPAVARFPSNTDWQYMRARAAYLANKFPQAIQTLEALLSNQGLDEKTKAQYNFLRGMAAKKIGDVEKAKTAFQEAFYGPYRDAARVELEGLDTK